MNSAIERLLSLRVSQVMSRRVVDISPHQTLAEAASLLSKHGLSGAPVVDELGRCVGMLTATDFLAQESHQSRAGEDGSLAGIEHTLNTETADESLHIDTVNYELVRHHMTTNIQAIDENATMLAAARAMCAGHIHRLPVLDQQGHVLGLVSSLDIVAALVQAIEE
jgi:CBS domain-containing protein